MAIESFISETRGDDTLIVYAVVDDALVRLSARWCARKVHAPRWRRARHRRGARRRSGLIVTLRIEEREL